MKDVARAGIAGDAENADIEEQRVPDLDAELADGGQGDGSKGTSPQLIPPPQVEARSSNN